jgi:hypothetical protein
MPSISLALSVLVKHVSAPLFLLDLLHQPDGSARRAFAERIRGYVPPALVVALLVVCSRSHRCFGARLLPNDWRGPAGYFFLPADAVMAIGTMAGLNLFPLALAIQAIFPLATLWTLWRYSQSPSREHFRLAAG